MIRPENGILYFNTNISKERYCLIYTNYWTYLYYFVVYISRLDEFRYCP